MNRQFLQLAVAAVFLAFSTTVCADQTPQRAGAFLSQGSYGGQGRYEGRNLAFRWNLQKTASSVTIQGQLKNIFYFVLEEVEVRGTLHDDGGRPLGKEAVFFVPGTLNLDENAAFTLNLPIPPSVVPSYVKVLYKYRELNSENFSASPLFFTFDIPL